MPAFPDEYPLLLFDGECVLCSANAQFVLKHDRKVQIRLSTVQGDLGRALYRHLGLDADATMILIENGRAYTESDAVIGLARGLGWPWRMAAALRIVPQGWRDALYRLIARNRFRLFGRRTRCWLPTADVADRIL